MINHRVPIIEWNFIINLKIILRELLKMWYTTIFYIIMYKTPTNGSRIRQIIKIWSSFFNWLSKFQLFTFLRINFETNHCSSPSYFIKFIKRKKWIVDFCIVVLIHCSCILYLFPSSENTLQCNSELHFLVSFKVF